MAALPLNWTDEKLAEALGYLCHPRTATTIEIQAANHKADVFEQSYRRLTQQAPPPAGTQHYSVLAPTSHKYGIQHRVIFTRRDNVPDQLAAIIQRDKGWQVSAEWRIARKLLVHEMFCAGFLLGETQEGRIRQRFIGVDADRLAAFDRGYAMAKQGP